MNWQPIESYPGDGTPVLVCDEMGNWWRSRFDYRDALGFGRPNDRYGFAKWWAPVTLPKDVIPAAISKARDAVWDSAQAKAQAERAKLKKLFK